MLERRQGQAPVLRRRPPKQADAVVAAHHDDVEHLEREAVVDLIALRHVPEAQPVDASHRAGHRMERPENGAENGRLPRAIGSHEPEEISLGNLEGEVGEHRLAPVAERGALEGDERAHETPSASCCTSWRNSEM